MKHISTHAEAKKALKTCAKVVKVEGGWLGFDSVVEYLVWKAQK